MRHKPVLLEESINLLVTDISGIYFDGTIGFCGHSDSIMGKLSPDGKLIATDKDSEAFDYSTTHFQDDPRVLVYHTGYSNIDVLSKIENINGFDGVFADLGVSSWQLDNNESGFTFRSDAALDLRMDKSAGISASEVLNSFKEEEIANIIYQYGEEKKSRSIAHAIVKSRTVSPFTNSARLREIVERCVPGRNSLKSVARVFQALRIYVNNELEELELFLDKTIDLLNPGGRIVIISYHSLEDRIVKEKFRYEAKDCICPPDIPYCVCDKESRVKIITKKPVVPGEQEVSENRRARSARLRAAEKL